MGDVHIRVEGRAGRITLTRPQALNALTNDMVTQMTDALDRWRDDAGIRVVILDAAGSRSFCAGGDVAAIWRLAMAGDDDAPRRFFADEYRLNITVANWPRPVVSFMQGHILGGGVGVGCNAGLRIVGASSRLAMPEAGIGLVPDATGSWHLAHAPGRIGEYLGLTGAAVGPGDALHAGLADRYVPEAEWPGLIARLAVSGDPSIIAAHEPPAASLCRRDLSAFGGADLAAITARLEAAGDSDTLALLHRNAPLSMAATLRMIRAARTDHRIEDSVRREYRFTSRAAGCGDFLEGVRARLIDKDNRPVWRQPSDAARVDAMLAPLGEDELGLPGMA